VLVSVPRMQMLHEEMPSQSHTNLQCQPNRTVWLTCPEQHRPQLWRGAPDAATREKIPVVLFLLRAKRT